MTPQRKSEDCQKVLALSKSYPNPSGHTHTHSLSHTHTHRQSRNRTDEHPSYWLMLICMLSYKRKEKVTRALGKYQAIVLFILSLDVPIVEGKTSGEDEGAMNQGLTESTLTWQK